MRLSGVLKDEQAVTFRHRLDRVHLGRLAVQMHRHDRARSRRNRPLDTARVEGIGAWVYVDRDRNGSNVRNGEPARDKGLSRHDDFVPRANPGGAQHKTQSVKAIAYADGMFRAAVGGEFALEGLEFRPEDRATAVDHPGDHGHRFGLCFGDHRRKIKEGHAHRPPPNDRIKAS